ncbi:hypothetical protein V3480_004075 [Vibrio cyclitrophicus]
MKDKSTYFDPDTSFFGLKIVKFTALVFGIFFLGACYVIIDNSKLWWEWDFTHVGFNNLLDYFKVPLAFLAMIIPTGAVFAANHRSEQTKKQIALTNKQNLFSNYYKHIEEFEKYTEKRLESVFDHEVFNHRRDIDSNAFDLRQYHKALFPNLLHTGEIQVDEVFLDKLESLFDISMQLKTEKVDSLDKVDEFLLKILNDLTSQLTNDHLSLGTLMVQGVTLKEILIRSYRNTQLKLLSQRNNKNVTNKAHCYSIIDSIERLHTVLRIIDTCARFDTSYETMECLQLMERLKSSIGKAHCSRITNFGEGEITKVLKVELFHDDEIPDNVSDKDHEDKVCSTTLAYSIMYGIDDLKN